MIPPFSQLLMKEKWLKKEIDRSTSLGQIVRQKKKLRRLDKKKKTYMTALSANERLVLDIVTEAGATVLDRQLADLLLAKGKFIQGKFRPLFKGDRGLKHVATRAGVSHNF